MNYVEQNPATQTALEAIVQALKTGAGPLADRLTAEYVNAKMLVATAFLIAAAGCVLFFFLCLRSWKRATLAESRKEQMLSSWGWTNSDIRIWSSFMTYVFAIGSVVCASYCVCYLSAAYSPLYSMLGEVLKK